MSTDNTAGPSSENAGPFTSATATYANLRTIADPVTETPSTGQAQQELFRSGYGENSNTSAPFSLHRPPDRQVAETTTLPPDSRSATTDAPIRKRSPVVTDLTRPSFSNLDFNLMQNPILLGDTITPLQATKFREQARARPQLMTRDLVTGKARNLVRYRLVGDLGQLYVSQENLETWFDVVPVTLAGEIICRYFSEGGVTADKPVAESLDNLTLNLNYADETMEDDSFYAIEEALRKHYQTHEEDLPDTLTEHAKILERKLPQNTQLFSDYMKRKREDMIGTQGVDSPKKVIMRLKICMTHVRNLRKSADRYGPFNETFSSNPRNLTGRHTLDTTIRSDQANNTERCQMCGLYEHNLSTCIHRGLPDVNTSGALWAESAIGERWKIFGFPAYRSDLTLPKGEKAARLLATQPEGQAAPFDHSDPANIALKQAHRAEKLRKKEEFSRNRNGGGNWNNPYNNGGGFNPYNNGGGNNPGNNGGNNYGNHPNNNNGNHPNNNGNHTNNNNHSNNNGGGRNAQGKEGGNAQRGKSESTGMANATFAQISVTSKKSDFLPALIFLTQQTTRTPAEANRQTPIQRAPPGSTEAQVLLDTGALGGDFISGEMVKKLKGEKFLYHTKSAILVCSGLDNACYTTTAMLDIGIEITSDDNIKQIFFIKTRVSESSKVDLIIGRPTIKKLNFLKWSPSHFSSETTEEIKGDTPKHTVNPQKSVKRKIDNTPSWQVTKLVKTGSPYLSPISERVQDAAEQRQITAPAGVVSCCTDHHLSLEVIPPNERVCRCPPTPAEKRVAWAPEWAAEKCGGETHTTSVLTDGDSAQIMAATLTESGDTYSRQVIAPDEIDDEKVDIFSPFLPDPNGTTHFLDQIKTEGGALFQQNIRTLCSEFGHIFSDKLGEQPARIPPFVINIDYEKWATPKNKGGPRPQTTTKEKQITEHIKTMIASGVIEKSTAQHWSHPVIVAKPDGSSRFCIDYRNLNECSEPGTWPLPNIAATFARIGSNNPKFFGVVDLSQGYHQGSLDPDSRKLSAFMCFSGVYQFTRVPFGPKRAPSYFQEMMSSVVLEGLIYKICEMYLDDCIIYASTEEEFLDRLHQVLRAFEKHNIFLKAKKCKFGLIKVEYVGKEISGLGLTMSEQKIQNVLDFPQPKTNTQLRSFLGLANYFRDFVPNHSHVVSPLHKMVDVSATKKSPITWEPNGVTSFHEVRRLISRCPLLYFVDDTAPITLMTDASDYGIGGYLFQHVDGVDQPVAFVSKSLTEIQLRWSTIQKEAYAIFHCCSKLNMLLRDRKFLILTDHANLQFLKNDSNQMVIRWWIAIQELDFKLEFVPGVENTIADTLSRLCPNLTLVDPDRVDELTPTILSTITEGETSEALERVTIATCHNELVGHGGIERTVTKLLTAGHKWFHMRQSVRKFIKECPCCQKMSAIKIPVNTTPFITSTEQPMEVINIDFVGPFHDKKYILVMVDTFTRWVELYCCPDATAKSAAQSLLAYFGRFGCPRAIRSDRGSHFANEVIQIFLQLVGVNHNLTLAYSSQENAKVERVNKEVNRHLRTYVYTACSAAEYERGIPFVQRILNSAPNCMTGISPAQLLFGNMIDLDRSIIIPYPERMEITTPTQTLLSEMLETQDRLSQLTRDIQRREDDHHINSNSEPITEFEIGSFVLVERRDGLPSRLDTLWLGPMRILEHKNSEYTLLNLITTKEKVYHAQHMRKFIFNPVNTDPTDVARRDYVEFFVQEILKHRGKPTRSSSMEFLVKWTGYEDSYNTWEPYTNLRKSEPLHAYLRAQNLLRLIPPEFRSKE